ncbi:MAG: ABC transporter substrate-binding protein [Proteobacteria bacterium]|nr:ABC transporter substrate-binding protein [Pseudomonadota bacterium]
MKKRSCNFIKWLAVVFSVLLPSSIQAADPVKIAAIFSKTGQAVVVPGIRPEFLAIQLAVSQLNDGGGLLGHPIEVLELDNQSTALGAKQAALEAIKAKVIAVIGANRSSHSLGMAPVLQTASIPMISPISTNPQVTLVGNSIFRVCFIDDFQGEVMATFAAKELQAKTAVVLTNASEKYSLSLAGLFIEKFKKLGGTILWEGDYLGDAVNFEEQLVKVKELKPDVCFVPGYNADTGFIIKQSREMGITSIFLSGDGLTQNIYKYAGSDAAGTYSSNHWHREDVDPKSRQFVQAYEKDNSKIIDPITALSYDAVMLLADAVKRANSIEPQNIRTALAETQGFKGVTGEITFDANRNPVNKSAVILKFEEDAWVYVKTITQ